MAINKSTTVSLLAAVAFVAYGVATYRVAAAKAQEQADQTDIAMQWARGFQAAAAATAEWPKVYGTISRTTDIEQILAKINLTKVGLFTNSADVVVTKVNNVSVKGLAIGLTSVCVASRGNQGGLLVTAADYPSLFSSLNSIARRRDVYFSRVSVAAGTSGASATLSPLCIYLRSEGA